MIKLNGTLLAREIQKRKIRNTDRYAAKGKSKFARKVTATCLATAQTKQDTKGRRNAHSPFPLPPVPRPTCAATKQDNVPTRPVVCFGYSHQTDCGN